MAKYRIRLGVRSRIASFAGTILNASLIAIVCSTVLVGQSDLISERFRLRLSDATDSITSAKFNADGSRVLLVGGKTAEVVETGTGRRLSVLRGGVDLSRDGFDFYWQPNGSYILQVGRSLSKKSTATLWDGLTGEKLAALEEDLGVRSAEWSSDGKRILTVGGSDGGDFLAKLSYSVRDENGHVKVRDRLFVRDLRLLSFSVSGNAVFWSFRPEKGQKAIQIFEADTGKFLKDFDHDLPGADSFTYSVFAGESPNGRYFCGQVETSKGVTCWSASDDSKSAYSFLDTKQSGDRVFLDFSPDSKYISVLRSREKVIDIADAATGRTKMLIDLPNGVLRVMGAANKQGRIYDYGNVWSSDGRFYVVTDVEKEVSIWDVLNGRLVSRRPTTWDTSYDVFVGDLPSDYERFSFNPKNNLLLSVSAQIARVWDAETGQLVRQFGANEKRRQDRTFQAYRTGWSPDGRHLLTSSDKNKELILWLVN